MPSFDVAVKIITAMVSPGEAVKAVLRMLNVGGPKAKVDVFVTYSAKTMQGELINERSETFAVVESKEKELELKMPGTASPGMYTFEAFVSYTGREALSTDTFEVRGEAAQAPGPGDNWIYIVIALLILVLVFMYFRLGRRLSRVEHPGPAAPGTARQSIHFLTSLASLISALAGRPRLHGQGCFFNNFFTTSPLILTISTVFKKGGTRWYMPSS